MSLLPIRRLVLSLALSLLWPAAAIAQTPDAPTPTQVQIKVSFVTVSTADLDKAGVTFDHVPSAQQAANPAQPGAFLHYVAGSTAVRLFQTLLRAGGRVVQAPLITTTDNIPATIQVSTEGANEKAGFLPIKTGLTIVPRINTDASITLSVAFPVADTDGLTSAAEPLTMLRTIRSGDMLAVAGLPIGSVNLSNGQRLLVFILPTTLGGGTQGDDMRQLSLPVPPAQDTSSLAGKTTSIDVYNAHLHTVVAMLARQLNLKASVQDGDRAYNTVYVHLNGASLSDVLAAIARSAGAQIIRDENGVYVFSSLPGAHRTPMPMAPASRGRSVTVTP